MKTIKIITMLAMLLALAVSVSAINVGNCTELMDINNSLNADYVLTNDIDCAGVSVTALGNSTSPFGGSIDGAGYTISNLDYGTTNKGFFGGYNVTAYDQVHDITFDNMTLVSSASGTSTLINEPIADFYINDINIINSQITGGQTDTGLLLGIGDDQDTATGYIANIRNIFVNNSNVEALNSGGVVIGKLTGGTNTVSNIQVINSNVSGNVALAGIVGDITPSNTTITNASFVGGRVVGVSHSSSGIVGRYRDSAGDTLIIRNAYAKGFIQAIRRGGGILGFVQNSVGNVDIDNVYSTVTLNDTNGIESGGIVGHPKLSSLTLDNAFALNGELLSQTYDGGLIGDTVGSITITNGYWQNITTTAVSCIGNPVSNAGCTVQDTTSYYYNTSNAPMSSWDISTQYTKDSVWVDQSYLNETPCLAFEDSCIAETEFISHSTPTTSELTQVGIQTINSASYVNVLTSTIEVPINSNISITATGDVLGSGSGSTATCRIVFDGVDYGNKTTTPANNQHKSFAIQSSLFSKTAGNYTLDFECRRDGSQRFDIENTELIITEYIDQNNDPITVGEDSATFNVTTTGYQLYETVSFNLSQALADTGFIKDVVFTSALQLNFDSTGTICFIVETNNVNSSEHCRYGAAGDSGTGSYFHIDANLTSGTETEKIYAKSTTGDGSITWDTIHFEIFGHEGEQDDVSFSSVPITSATYQTVANDTIEIENHTGVAILSYAGFSVRSNSGAADMSFRLVLQGVENGSVINRDVLAANQDGLVSVQEEFENLSAGNYTILLQAQSDNSDATITGGELISFTSNEVIVEPSGYFVYAYSSFDGSPLSGFNVTTASDGTVYQSDNGFAFIPESVATENVTVSKTGFTSNITLNHNTTNDLSVNLTPDAPTLLLTLSPSDSIVQPTQSTATGSGCPSGLTCSLYRNGVLVSNPDIQTLTAGSYVYVYNTTGNANYSAASVTDTLTVTAPNPECTRLSDRRVSFNTSFTWNSQCTHINGLENVTVSCDDGFNLNDSNTNLNGSNYNITASSNPISSVTTCTITANSFTGEQTVYTQILTPAQGGELIFGVCPDTTLGFNVLWFMFVATITLVLAGFVLRIPLLAFLGSTLGLFMGLYLIGCVMVLGLLTILIGLFMMVYTMVLMPNQRY